MRKSRSASNHSHGKPKTTHPSPAVDPTSAPHDAQSSHTSSPLTSATITEKSSVSPSRLPVKLTRNPSIRPTTAVSNNLRPRPTRSSAVNRSATVEPEVTKDRSKTLPSTSRHLRNPSSNSSVGKTRESNPGRARSSTTFPTSSNSRPPTRGSVDGLKVPLLSSEPQAKKPSFSTLQQHFSPAKNLAPKPHPAAFLAPPTPSKWPSNKATTAETAKLQNELLQLHLIHQESLQANREWRSSARRKLETKFYAVVEKKDVYARLEKQENSRRNAAGLKKWEETGVPGWALEEKMQVLEQLLADVCNVSASGGKLARVIKRFDCWVAQCQPICNTWTHDLHQSREEIRFIEELESTWKDDCLILGRKIEAWMENLRDLGVAESRSGLGMLLANLQRIVRGMRTELSLMMQIEEDVMETELSWIKRMINDESNETDTPGTGAIWRTH